MFSQEYPSFSVEELDKVFNNRMKKLDLNNESNRIYTVIDTSVVQMAQRGIYVPTSINMYFSNVDSIFKSTFKDLNDKHQKFLSQLKHKGIANLDENDCEKYQIYISDIASDNNLRLCLYAIYDLELQENQKELIIVDLGNNERKEYFSRQDTILFNTLKPILVSEIINDCNYDTANYSFYIIKNHGEIYPKRKSADEYLRFYSNDSMSWQLIDKIITTIYEISSNLNFKIVYAHITIKCEETVECPPYKKPTNDGFGSSPQR